MSWSAHVGGQRPESFVDEREAVWHGLLRKAENPVGYVPAITRCEILERHQDGLTRRILRDGRTITQRVTFDKEKWRIVFRHLDDPDVAAIINELARDQDGLLTLTMGIELSPTVAASLTELSPFLRNSDMYFTRTIAAVAKALDAR